MRIAFADESGTDGSSRCYAIGVLSFPEDRIIHFEEVFAQLIARHGVTGEAKWSKVGNSHGLINFTIDWLDRILRSRSASFDVIVVNTFLYQEWAKRGANREQAFYKTYTFLLRHIARKTAVPTRVLLDDRSDAYPLQHEAMETIGNRMLAQLASAGRLTNVERVRSKDSPGVQVADLLTGAFAAAHRLYLAPGAQVNASKRLAICKLANVLGWDNLHYDTHPHPKLNVWHFQIEFRADPATREVLGTRPIEYVTAEELARAREAG